ncbi:unnamed protein product [Ilex paraguariensis]|uniref:Pre-rRNA-processing protein Ipi1 N-terminal domain-containing protein n=1 Tax=Ilex paraguariensis TaxID=185542 RepID=A0ABC8UIA5_9AQUA
MVRSKAPTKKQQKRGVDFKKIKRKIGRKLPPPKNATNTEIKSKAIILPEQSVASEKAGLAVSKKGLTLKELLQQTSHHNAKVRKDALTGIRDIFLKYPAELKLHKLAVIEKLRERISDEDKLVRETLYQLLKAVIFPGCKEESQGPFISLMMAYIFNAMTHLAIDVRLMAFKFFDVLVQFYPYAFLLNAEKILQNYEDILRKNQFYLQDKGKLKSALAGLTRCLLLLPCNKGEDDSSFLNDVAAQGILHAFEPEALKDPTGISVIVKKLEELLPILVNCFHDFVALVQTMPLLDAQSFDCMLSILQSIDLVVRSFGYGIHKGPQPEIQVFPPRFGRSDVTRRDQAISPVLLKKLWDLFPLKSVHHLSDKDEDRYFILNVIITVIFLRLSDWICPPTPLLEIFLEFMESSLSEKIQTESQSVKSFHGKHVLALIPFIPKLIMRVADNWKSCILQAFTKVFESCSPESSLKLACLSAIEEMLVPKHGWLYLDASDPKILEYQLNWIRELPSLLILLGDRHPLCSKAVLRLQLRLGQIAPLNSTFSQEFDNMQYSLREFYSTCLDDRSVCYGPFIRLPREIQELSVCCLYYFSFLDSFLLQSLVSCCLCDDLEPLLLFRVLEVLHSAYKAGHIQIADHISFLFTLLSRFKVFPGDCFAEKIYSVMEDGDKSNRGTFKLITSVVCSCLSEIGDDYLVVQMLEKIILDQISLKPPVDNICALLRMLITVDSKPTRLSEQSITNLSNFLPGYLIDAVSSIPEDDNKSSILIRISSIRYYLLPCFFLFYRSDRLLNLVLDGMGSLVTDNGSSPFSHHHVAYANDYSSRIAGIVSVLLLLHKDAKIHKILLSCKIGIYSILQKIQSLQSSEEIKMTIEERHKIQCAFDRLKVVMSASFSGIPVN